MKFFIGLWLLIFTAGVSQACIWDADTLAHEQSRSKDLAAVILGQGSAPEDVEKLRARIADLNAHRNENSAEWLNNLAGAHLRLNEPAEAVKILEPVAAVFTNDYGVHANLGTAYHLLGRYADAEKEIARDLEINPEAHFGLEKYHLALLQYLTRDSKYKFRHLYVDELTASFLMSYSGRLDRYAGDRASDDAKASFTNGLKEAESYLAVITPTNNLVWTQDSLEVLTEVSTLDPKPDYRAKWDLAEDTNFEAGVIYMAQMNPKEPACVTMLGVAAWKKRDYNLAVKAFERAIALNSPQAELLRVKIEGLNTYIHNSLKQARGIDLAGSVLLLCLATFAICAAILIFRAGKRILKARS